MLHCETCDIVYKERPFSIQCPMCVLKLELAWAKAEKQALQESSDNHVCLGEQGL